MGAVGRRSHSHSAGAVPTLDLVDTETTTRSGETASPRSSACSHCGLPCGESPLRGSGKQFCCAGCQAVFELLSEGGLDEFYRLGGAQGVRGGGADAQDRFA
ncbi:MAG: hypothetical protein EBU81_13360, partial [Proteobacteria bacterium]|nr:hypothetical protein [Pseudomonadota bacterium]